MKSRLSLTAVVAGATEKKSRHSAGPFSSEAGGGPAAASPAPSSVASAAGRKGRNGHAPSARNQ